MMRFWGELGVQFSQHVLCSDEIDSAKRLDAHVLKGVTLEELFFAMQELGDAMSQHCAAEVPVSARCELDHGCSEAECGWGSRPEGAIWAGDCAL